MPTTVIKIEIKSNEKNFNWGDLSNFDVLSCGEIRSRFRRRLGGDETTEKSTNLLYAILLMSFYPTSNPPSSALVDTTQKQQTKIYFYARDDTKWFPPRLKQQQ